MAVVIELRSASRCSRRVLLAALLIASSPDLAAQAGVQSALDRLRAVRRQTTVPLDTMTIKSAVGQIGLLLPLDGDSAVRAEVAATYAAVGRRLLEQRLGYEIAIALFEGALRYAPEAAEAPHWRLSIGIANASYAISLTTLPDSSGSCDAVQRFRRKVTHALAALEAGRAANPQVADGMAGMLQSLLDRWHVCWPNTPLVVTAPALTAQQAPLPPQAQLDAITDRGRALAAYDQAAWHALLP